MNSKFWNRSLINFKFYCESRVELPLFSTIEVSSIPPSVILIESKKKIVHSFRMIELEVFVPQAPSLLLREKYMEFFEPPLELLSQLVRSFYFILNLFPWQMTDRKPAAEIYKAFRNRKKQFYVTKVNSIFHFTVSWRWKFFLFFVTASYFSCNKLSNEVS